MMRVMIWLPGAGIKRRRVIWVLRPMVYGRAIFYPLQGGKVHPRCRPDGCRRWYLSVRVPVDGRAIFI